MGSARDERRGTPSVLTEQEDRRGIESERVREREKESSSELQFACVNVQKYLLLRAPAFVTQDNEASLCVIRSFLLSDWITLIAVARAVRSKFRLCAWQWQRK